MNHAKSHVDSILVGTGPLTASVSASFDRIGFNHATVRVLINKRASTDAGAMTLSLLDCDTTVVTDHATVTANLTPTPGAAATEQRYELDLRARKRYLRLVITPGTHTSGDIQGTVAIITVSRQSELPTAQSTLVGSGSTVTVV
jgi:hypothetical protein